MLSVRVVGDFDPHNETHLATTAAIEHASVHLGVDVDVVWTETADIGPNDTAPLGDADAILIAPASPYRNMDGALAAITYARTRDVPLLGTCGGFQHVVVEFARNVLGVREAEHAESSPDALTQVITPLTCSLFGQRMEVDIKPGTQAHAAYGRDRTTERYYCNFGLNPEYTEALIDAGLAVGAADQNGGVRILEHPGRRFFMGTLFVPQTSSSPGAPHPLIVALVDAARHASVPTTIASNDAIALKALR